MQYNCQILGKINTPTKKFDRFIIVVKKLSIMKNFFLQTGRGFIAVFRGRNLLWHGAAIALTWGIVVSGFDWNFFQFAASFPLREIFFPGLFLGTFLPVLFPIGLFLWGRIAKKADVELAGICTAQAAILGSLISSIYKAFTGRIQPPMHGFLFDGTNAATLPDTSHMFQFGFLQNGIFWGWPSSHTTIAFAMALAIWTLFPKHTWIRVFAIVYAFFIGIGTALTNIHWFSEFASGTIFGSLIGIVIGNLTRTNKQKKL